MAQHNDMARRDDAALLAGDADAFAEFYRRHEAAILSYFMRRVDAPELAADLAAETFARVLTHRRRFDPERGEPRAWLFGVARKVLLRSYEARQVEDRARRALEMQPVVIDDGDLARIRAASDDVAVAALGSLPGDQESAVTGRIVDELDYPELAARLQCSESVVRQRVSRGLKGLRAQLGAR